MVVIAITRIIWSVVMTIPYDGSVVTIICLWIVAVVCNMVTMAIAAQPDTNTASLCRY